MRDLLLLLFTSGTSGAPKAVICTQGKLSIASQNVADIARLGRARASATWRCRCSTATASSWAGGRRSSRAEPRCCGASSRRRRRCRTSASTAARTSTTSASRSRTSSPSPSGRDDADNPLELVFGNEAADLDIERFSEALRRARRRRLRLDRDGRHRAPRARTCRRARSAAADAATEDPRSGDGQGMSARRSSTPQGRLAERRGGDRRAREHGAASALFEGYYKNDEAERAADARTAGTGRATSPTATPTASSTSPAATSSGCASTARTSPPRRSSGSSRATRAWCSPPSTRCPTRTWATR